MRDLPGCHCAISLSVTLKATATFLMFRIKPFSRAQQLDTDDQCFKQIALDFFIQYNYNSFPLIKNFPTCNVCACVYMCSGEII